MSGSFLWNGLLDEYFDDELYEKNLQYCRANMVFAKITIKVRDHYLAGR